MGSIEQQPAVEEVGRSIRQRAVEVVRGQQLQPVRGAGAQRIVEVERHEDDRAGAAGRCGKDGDVARNCRAGQIDGARALGVGADRHTDLGDRQRRGGDRRHVAGDIDRSNADGVGTARQVGPEGRRDRAGGDRRRRGQTDARVGADVVLDSSEARRGIGDRRREVGRAARGDRRGRQRHCSQHRRNRVDLGGARGRRRIAGTVIDRCRHRGRTLRADDLRRGAGNDTAEVVGARVADRDRTLVPSCRVRGRRNRAGDGGCRSIDRDHGTAGCTVA